MELGGQQHMAYGPEFQSVMDMSSLLKLSAAEDLLKDDRMGETLVSVIASNRIQFSESVHSNSHGIKEEIF